MENQQTIDLLIEAEATASDKTTKLYLCCILGALYGNEQGQRRLANLCGMFCQEQLEEARRDGL